jgi:hypothetical protein
MIVIERTAGEAVQIGPYALQVLAVQPGRVVVALFDPARDCACCGERPAGRRRCRVCGTEAMVCRACVRSRPCPQCASPWEH